MERRTYESPMDWEYQTHGPMDPSSPFVQSAKKPAKSIFGTSNMNGSHSNGNSNNTNNTNNSFSHNPFQRTQSTPSPSKPLPPTPPHQSSIFSTSTLQRTTTAPPFRNPAFTTPRKPFDMDTLSEFSPAESSPAVTDASDYPDTPENDRSYNLAQATITPSTMNKNKAFSSKKAGKGEIAKTVFPSRDKVRKRKRYNADKDVSGYRLPYVQQDEYDESDYESDESTFQPGRPRQDQANPNNDGWFATFLSTIQRHPYAPSILGYWVSFVFNVCCVSAACWIGWAVIGGLRHDFQAARQRERASILADIEDCMSDYTQNKCHPIEKRLPAMHAKCDEWLKCMNQNPDDVKQVSNGAKEMAKILNDIVETMSYKTIVLLIVMFTIFIYSGRSLYKSANAFTDIPQGHPAAPFPSHHAGDQHMRPPSQQVYWQAIEPQTPRHRNRHLLTKDETPDTDEAQHLYALPAPQTPASRRSPSKGERGRSPTKSRSPTKRY